MASLITEGVFAKYPEAQGGADRVRRDLAAGLPVALLQDSGAACAPRCRGSTVRRPKSCATISASRSQPFDAPSDPDEVERILEHLRFGRDAAVLSDFPHWQFDGDERMPREFPKACGARYWWTIRSRRMIG